MKILVLDDDENRLIIFRRKLIGHVVTCVTTSTEAIQQLESYQFDVVCLDHDLGGQAFVESGPGTGYEVAQWLATNENRQPQQIFIHSFNEPAAKRMHGLLPKAVVAPGLWINIKMED
jgi:CheY-like chemotaxis protein